MAVENADPLDVAAIREDFPVLERRVGGNPTTPGQDADDDTPLVYLDNAATSQTPEPVVEAMSEFYRSYNANVHRGIHQLSQEASVAYEAAHDRVADFVNAGGRDEVVFTKNTTEAINLVAGAWALRELGPEDEIVLTQMEHHSSLVTFQQIGKRTGATVRYVPVTERGDLDLDAAADMITEDTALVAAVHVSNTMGARTPVGDLADLAHEHGAAMFVDAAQSVPHQPVDVRAIDADFLAFSGHKMCGPTGIGVLYGKRERLAEMEPFLYGGGMIERVAFEETTWAELPWKFEAGTPPIAEAVGLAAAVDYLEDVGLGRIESHGTRLAEYAHERLAERDDVEVYGPPPGERAALVSFNLEGVHAHDLSTICNDHGVAVRAGDHCTQPLHDVLGVPATTRASFYLYNTRAEVDALLEAVDAARDLFA
ncbi:MAG: aminotransferase class V-fold PLP-dependent enzyme [Halobacteriaceae archaeon]